MTIATTPFYPAEYLDDQEAIVAYLDEALATGDAAFVAEALGVIARARGMSELARETFLSRENLYRALSAGGNAEFATIMRVVSALGLHLTAASNQLVEIGRKQRPTRAVGRRGRKPKGPETNLVPAAGHPGQAPK